MDNEYPHGSFWSQGKNHLSKATVKAASIVFVMVMLYEDDDPIPVQITKSEMYFRIENHVINNWRYHKESNELYIG